MMYLVEIDSPSHYSTWTVESPAFRVNSTGQVVLGAALTEWVTARLMEHRVTFRGDLCSVTVSEHRPPRVGYRGGDAVARSTTLLEQWWEPLGPI